MSLRDKVAASIDSQYAAHPDAAAIRDRLDAAGVDHLVLAGDKHGTGQAVINARQEKRRKQVRKEIGEYRPDTPEEALYASHIAVEQITGEHRIPVEVTHPDGPIKTA